jgi:hypothetical protein
VPRSDYVTERSPWLVAQDTASTLLRSAFTGSELIRAGRREPRVLPGVARVMAWGGSFLGPRVQCGQRRFLISNAIMVVAARMACSPRTARRMKGLVMVRASRVLLLLGRPGGVRIERPYCTLMQGAGKERAVADRDDRETGDREVNLEQVGRLIEALEADLKRVQSGSRDIQRLRDEVETLKNVLNSPVRRHHWVRDGLHGIREVIESALDKAKTEGFKGTQYISEIGRILGM